MENFEACLVDEGGDLMDDILIVRFLTMLRNSSHLSQHSPDTSSRFVLPLSNLDPVRIGPRTLARTTWLCKHGCQIEGPDVFEPYGADARTQSSTRCSEALYTLWRPSTRPWTHSCSPTMQYLTVAALAFAPLVRAWGNDGHEIVGYVAMNVCLHHCLALAKLA